MPLLLEYSCKAPSAGRPSNFTCDSTYVRRFRLVLWLDLLLRDTS